MTENNEKKVSPEFINSVKKYLEIDDIIKDYREKMKKLNADKKINEEFILNYLTNLKEDIIDVHNGKLKRSITKTQSPLKKEIIQKTLTDIIGDNLKALNITDQIIKSRPIIEKISLKRTINKNK
jgi:hypothetical protein